MQSDPIPNDCEDASVADYDGGVRERGSASFTRPHSRWVSGPTAPRLHPITEGPSHPANLVRN